MICPKYSKLQIEIMADELNKEYNPQRLSSPLQVDVFDIVDMLGARIAIDYLSPDRTYLGATVFSDGFLWIWPGNPFKKNMMPTKKIFRADTIIIDTNLDSSPLEQDNFSENFTVIHECFHFARHRASFKHCVHYSSANEYSSKQTDHDNDLSRLEWQANYAAAAFLMPRQAVINGAMEYFKTKDYTGKIPFGYASKEKIRNFARLFGVNYSPMVYRMQELGLLEEQFNSLYR